MITTRISEVLVVAALALSFTVASTGEVHAKNDALKGAVIGAGVGGLIDGKSGALKGGLAGAIIGS